LEAKKVKKIKWAVVGTGHIAKLFTQGLMLVSDAERSAVVSRSADKAQSFAKQYDFHSSFSDFREMLDTVRPDVVYIAVPNDCHFDYVMQALDAGANVLCEKPMPDNLAQLRCMLQKAKDTNLFLMEGMWTRCFPAVQQARQWIAAGRIGKVLAVHCFFDIKTDVPDWQFWKAGIEHAAGALRDVGIYSLAMAFLGFADYPQKIYSNHVSNGEVDSRFDLMLQYADGGVSFLSGAFDRISEHETLIIGETGRITIGPEFWHPTDATLLTNDGSAELFNSPYESTGFQFEILRVQECLREGLKECPDFTWHESTQICTLIDSLRRDWHIVYRSDSAVYL
jgi:dihydrodiol dehydrogenase / D-xylose 1-dehydrogenase (NADP)